MREKSTFTDQMVAQMTLDESNTQVRCSKQNFKKVSLFKQVIEDFNHLEHQDRESKKLIT